MRHYFFDTSALAKLYSIEPGSRRVRDMVRSAAATPPSSRVLACELVHPETASALTHALASPDAAQRGLGSLARKRLPEELARDLGPESNFVFTEIDELMPYAADLVWKHRIRGADAVHVAAALAARPSVRWTEFYFVSADKAQKAAAAAEGLDVIDPTG